MAKAIEKFREVDPAIILADDNVRFALRKERISSMKDSIIAKGGVMVPIEVDPLTKEEAGDSGFLYRITAGHYRHAGLVAANAEGAGLLMPVIVHSNENEVERLDRQLAENTDRENMTPMDTATAIKKYMDAGVSRIEIRNRFQRPGPGKTMQPASNSWLNITLSFLELPKKIQNKIHDGTLGVKAAYELMKAYKVAEAKGKDPAEMVTKILEAAEADSIKAVEQDDEDEKKLLAEEAKQEEDSKKLKEAEAALEAAKATVEAGIKTVMTLAEEGTKLFAATKNVEADVEAKKAAYTAFRAKEQEAQDAERALDKARKEVLKIEGKVKTAAETASDRAKQLKEARDAAAAAAATNGKGKGKGPNQDDIRKASEAVGATTTVAPMNASDMRKFVANLTLAGGEPPVIALGKILVEAFSNKITESEAYKALKELLGVPTVAKGKKGAAAKG